MPGQRQRPLPPSGVVLIVQNLETGMVLQPAALLLRPAIEGINDTAEFGRIGRYYASESMLVWDEQKQCYDADATPSYGTDTLEQFFERVAREGMAGQDLGDCLLYTSPSPRDLSTSRMPSSA